MVPSKKVVLTKNEAVLSAKAYVFVALGGFVVGIALLFFYVFEVPKLLAGGIQAQVFYLLLVPWALSCAAFLFGAMRSVARFTHRQFGSVLELGGPVVLFCLVVVGGFRLVPATESAFDLTVRVSSEDQPMISSGKITLRLGNTSRTEEIGSNGEANFKGVPVNFRDQTVQFLSQTDNCIRDWQGVRLVSNVVELKLQPPRQETHLRFSILDKREDWSNLRVVAGGRQGRVGEAGEVDLAVKGCPGDWVRVVIYKNGVSEPLKDEHRPLPAPTAQPFQIMLAERDR